MELLLTLLFMLPCPLLFIGGILGLVLYVSKSARNKRNLIWSRAAEKLGLQFTPAAGWLDQPMLQGRIQDVEVKIDILVRGSGKHRQVFTRARAPAPDAMPEGTIVGAEGLLDGIGKLFGVQDIELGVPAVDEKLLIKGRDEDAVRAFLKDPRIQRACLELVSSFQEGRLRDEGVEVLRRGDTNDIAVFGALCQKVVDLHLKMSPDRDEETERAAAEPETETASLLLTADTPFTPPELLDPLGHLDFDHALLQGLSGSDPEPPQGLVIEAFSSTLMPDLLAEAGLPVPPSPAPVDEADEAIGAPEDEAHADAAIGAPEDEAHADEAIGAPEDEAHADAAIGAPEDEAHADAAIGAPEDEAHADAAIGAPEDEAHADAAIGAPAQLFDLLRRLGNRSTRASEQRKIEASIMGQPISLTLTVDRVRRTLGFRAPAHLKGGHTVIGRQEDMDFAIRFLPERSAEIEDLDHGDVLQAAGRVAGWESLYRQAVVDAD